MRILDTATSALNALSVDMMVRSNNIANMNTPGFKASDVTLTTGPDDQGVALGRIYKDLSPGGMIPGGGTTYVEGGNTDLSREFSHMVVTEAAYKANATLIRTHEDMTGAVLDMIA